MRTAHQQAGEGAKHGTMPLARAQPTGASDTRQIEHRLAGALLCLVAASAAGCAATRVHPAHAVSAASTHRELKDDAVDLRHAAELCKVPYFRTPNQAIAHYNELGYDASYYAPASGIVHWLDVGPWDFPELYLLSRKASGEVIVVFVGSNSGHDWFQNLKVTNYQDSAVTDQMYIMPGHGGFRAGMLNLIGSGFFDLDPCTDAADTSADDSCSALTQHLQKYQVESGDTPIRIILTGHSQGAGLAQLAASLFDGFHYLQDGRIAVQESWPYRVVRILRYASPYAVSKAGCVAEQTCPDPWKLIADRYADITYNVIRDDDMVPMLWDVTKGHAPTTRHFGRLVRITRDGEARLEATTWPNEQPHHIDSYIEGLRSLTIP